MPLYDTSGRLMYDACSQEQRDRINADSLDYLFGARRHLPAKSTRSAADASLEHRNLRLWDGFGMAPGAVSKDTELRLDAAATRGRSKLGRQLATRIFTAAPDLAHGTGDPDRESSMRHESGNAGAAGVCPPRRQQVSEADFDRFDPGVCARSVDSIVPPWTEGGASSRDIARRRAFQRALHRQRLSAAAAAPVGRNIDGSALYASVQAEEAEGDRKGNNSSVWQRLIGAATGCQ